MIKDSRLKVLQLGKFFPIKGGVEKVMYDLMIGLSERAVDCDMLCAVSKGSEGTVSLNAHARLIGCKTLKTVAATKIAPDMIAVLRQICQQYDIIHVHHPDPMACLALFLSGYKGKVVLHWHSDIQKQKILLRLYEPLQSWMIRRADKIVGTTPVYLAESPYLRHVQQKTEVLPIGVLPMVPDAEGVRKIRERYAGRKIVFSLGRLVAYKGYRYLVDAAKYLDDSYVILIGGSGALKNELQAQITANNLQHKVILLGRVSDEELPSYYGACDVFCMSSVMKTEAFGIVQIEAMSCGKPVIATNIPHSGVSWVNAHGCSGLNVTPGNSEEMAEAIKAIVNNRETYDTYSQGAMKRYQDVFTKEQMINQCLNIYKRL